MAAGAPGGPVVLEGPVSASPTVLAWEAGERDRWWSRAAALEHGREQPDWVTAVTSANYLSDLTPAQLSWLIVGGPEPSARALLGRSLVSLRHQQQIDVDRVAVARFELDALPLVLRDAGENADRLGMLVLPFRGAEPAALVAGWLRHLGSARLWARLWLHRHAETAARALVPAAAGRPGRARQQAQDALRYLAATGHGPTVAEAAEAYGAERPSLLPIPANAGRNGRAPAWMRPGGLPEVVRTDGGALPPDEVARLVEALTWARLAAPPEPPPGDPAPSTGGVPLAVESSAAVQPFVHQPEPEAEQLIADCDSRSVARLGRALLDAWVADGMPAAQAWVVLAQAHVGDDATMDVLAPLVRSWPARSRWARAVDGYAVLATVGTDAALRHLLAIEEGMAGGPTNERATAYLTAAAERRGLSVTQLADRLAATHGLDAGVTVDYGPRAFTVVTDEHLTAFAVDATGRRLARLPKPGARDTNPAAYQQFQQLKKDLRATATAQSARLQRDMLARRTRPARDVRGVLLPHPVLGPIARRLLWGEYDPRHRLIRALRIAEDGSFADVHDMTATVEGDAPLGIVHPAELDADLPRWTQVVTDYEILPPFPQVHRPVVLLTGAQRAATSLAWSEPAPAAHLLGLLQRGRWHGNGLHPQRRLHTQLSHRLPGARTLLVEIDPGVPTWAAGTAPDQRVTEIWADDAWSDHLQQTRHIAMGTCDQAALSELLVELYRQA